MYKKRIEKLMLFVAIVFMIHATSLVFVDLIKYFPNISFEMKLLITNAIIVIVGAIYTWIICKYKMYRILQLIERERAYRKQQEELKCQQN